MTAFRLFAILFILVSSAIAWGILGGSVTRRSRVSDQELRSEVARLWGGKHDQLAPRVWYNRIRTVTEEVEETDARGGVVRRQVSRQVVDEIPAHLSSSRVAVDLKLEHRRKGLLWFDTYTVEYRGTYQVHYPPQASEPLYLHYRFPSTISLYDGFVFRVDGEEINASQDLSNGITVSLPTSEQDPTTVEIGYRSRGLDTWRYRFVPKGMAQVHDFELVMRTNFRDIDFPAGTISPSAKEDQADGWELTWRFDNLVSGNYVGIDLPNLLNPGPLAARITFFAPVSLLFFVTVLVILGVRKKVNLHPMHYFFLAASFFAFHLLLAYLVDHFGIHLSFLLSALTSIILVLSYLRLVHGFGFALYQAVPAQIVFLVLFSYAFFFKGYTGLTVTVGAIVTLFVLMQLTGRTNWDAVFERQRKMSGEAWLGRNPIPHTEE